MEKYVIKVKNILGKNKTIKLLNGAHYTLRDKEEKVIGDYSIEAKPTIFNLLKAGFEVSKILKENVQEHMIINSNSKDAQTVPELKKDEIKENTNDKEEIKPKRKRGRPKN